MLCRTARQWSREAQQLLRKLAGGGFYRRNGNRLFLGRLQRVSAGTVGTHASEMGSDVLAKSTDGEVGGLVIIRVDHLGKECVLTSHLFANAVSYETEVLRNNRPEHPSLQLGCNH